MREYEGGDYTIEIPIEKCPIICFAVPCYKDADGLKRTLVNIVLQDERTRQIPRRVYVVHDGKPDKRVVNAVMYAQGLADREGQNVGFTLSYVPHFGTGNPARAAAQNMAEGNWLCYIDSGTAVCRTFMMSFFDAIVKHPDAKIIAWDMVQLIEPSPVVTSIYAIRDQDRSNGLPYVIPGCATAIRLPEGKLVPWPNVRASDWAYWSLMWKELFGFPEDAEKVDKEVILIPKVLVVAYGNRTLRKDRAAMNMDSYHSAKYHLGWEQAAEEWRADMEAKKANVPTAEPTGPESSQCLSSA